MCGMDEANVGFVALHFCYGGSTLWGAATHSLFQGSGVMTCTDCYFCGDSVFSDRTCHWFYDDSDIQEKHIVDLQYFRRPRMQIPDGMLVKTHTQPRCGSTNAYTSTRYQSRNARAPIPQGCYCGYRCYSCNGSGTFTDILLLGYRCYSLITYKMCQDL